MSSNPTLESRVRRKARRLGYQVCKSRERKHVPHGYNFGKYVLADLHTRAAVIGWNYDATLDEIEFYLDNVQAEQVAA